MPSKSITPDRDNKEYEVSGISDEYWDRTNDTFYFRVHWVGYSETDWIPHRHVSHLDLYMEFINDWRHKGWKKRENIEFLSCEHCGQWSPGRITKVTKPRNGRRGYLSISYRQRGINYRVSHIAFGSSLVRHLSSKDQRAMHNPTNHRKRRKRQTWSSPKRKRHTRKTQRISSSNTRIKRRHKNWNCQFRDRGLELSVSIVFVNVCAVEWIWCRM